MKSLITSIAVAFLLLGPAVAATAAGPSMTFQDRVEAQEAIERVYYSHVSGATRSFEEAVPRELLETKVRRYLRQSAALERFWKSPITAGMLRAEMGRMERETRMPDRLAELYGALGDDPLVIQECLARQILADRLARGFFAMDRTLHADARHAAERLRDSLASGRIDPHAEHPARTVEESSAGEPGRRSGAHQGRAGEIGPLEEETDRFAFRVLLKPAPGRTRTATYTVTKRTWDDWWREVEADLDPASVEPVASLKEGLAGEPGATSTGSGCVTDDTWTTASGAPEQRADHTAVWTGTEMIVWGGCCYPAAGGRYDPATDTWTPTSTVNAPSGRSEHTAVWTGTEMIVWGGGTGGYSNTGGRYDPTGDRWTPTSTLDAPEARAAHTAVWTGSVMVVWGGFNGSSSGLNTGGRYDPATDTWTPTTTEGAPVGRQEHTAVWTGSRMIVWGGWAYLSSGGRYDPVTDTWQTMSASGAPAGRYGHLAVWTGTLMLAWGGVGAAGALNSGGRYDPSANTWSAMVTAGAPPGGLNRSAIWTGTRMVVWGGSAGGRYDPTANTWAPVSVTNAPSSRTHHSAVWTGIRMIVWGGSDTVFLNTGGRYDPSTDTWTPMSPHTPPERHGHVAVWTGGVMILWGGFGGGQTGGRYDPVTNNWTGTSTINAPVPRGYHSAVWTGSVMVVWGGEDGSGGPTVLNSGGRYDPLSDTWSPTSLVDAPEAREHHSAVWTGTRMIIWGGDQFYVSTVLNSGGLYDPAADTWTATSNVDAPSARSYHTAVWSGSRMIVWGAAGDRSGGRYDPVSDTWTPTSTLNAPPGAGLPAVVWTGSRMVVWQGGSRSGGRYDPIADTWAPVSPVNGPPGYLTGVWSGAEMLAWGSTVDFSVYLAKGGRYNPQTDSWRSMNLTGCPSGRIENTAVWADGVMVVWGGANETTTFNNGGRYCACTMTVFHRDADGDGRGDPAITSSACVAPAGYVADATDCDDADASQWSVPGEVCDLLFTDSVMMTWSPPMQPGAASDLYDVIRTDLPTDFISGATCLVADLAAVTTADSLSPPPGLIYYYLARAENWCPNGSGPLGSSSDGTLRTGRTCP